MSIITTAEPSEQQIKAIRAKIANDFKEWQLEESQDGSLLNKLRLALHRRQQREKYWRKK